MTASVIPRSVVFPLAVLAASLLWATSLFWLPPVAQADPGVPSPAHSEFTVDLDSIPLLSAVDVTITVRDSEGTPLPGIGVSFWALIDMGAGPVPLMIASNHPDFGTGAYGFFPIVDNGDGTYTPQVMAGSLGPQTVSAYIGFEGTPEHLIGTVSGTIRAADGQPDPSQSSVTISNDAPLSGEVVTLTMTLRDWQGTPLDGFDTTTISQTIRLGSDPTEFPAVFPPWTPQGGGIYTITIPVEGAGEVAVTFLFDFAPGQSYVIDVMTADIQVPPPGPLASFAITGLPGSTIPGVPIDITVTALDADDAVIASGPNALSDPYDVIVSIDGETDGVGLGTVTLNFVEGVAEHTVRFVVPGEGQVLTVTSAEDAGITGSAPAVDAAFGQPAGSASTIEADSASTLVGDEALFTITLRDIGGNPIAGSVGSISLYLNDEGESLSAPVELGNGVYQATIVPTEPGPFFIAAYIGANHGEWAGLGDPIGTAASAGHAGPLAAFEVVASPGGGALGNQAAGVPVTLQVRAVDAQGYLLDAGPNALNGAHDATVTVVGSTVGSTGTGAVTLTFAQGIATHTVTLSDLQPAEQITVTSAEAGSVGILGASAEFVVHPGPLAAFVFEVGVDDAWEPLGPSFTTSADSLASLRITAVDAIGHTLNAGPNLFAEQVTLSSNASGSGAIGFGTTPAFSAGVLTLDGTAHPAIRMTSARPDAAITAQRGGGVSTTSALFAVTPGAAAAGPSSLTIPASVALDEAANAIVTLRDAYGNRLNTGGDAVALIASDAPDTAITAVDAGNGQYTSSFARSTATTLTVHAYLGADGTGELIGSVTVTFQAVPLPDEEPGEEGPQTESGSSSDSTLVPEAGQILVPIPNPTRTPLTSSGATSASANSLRGGEVQVIVGDRAIGNPSRAGLTLEVGFVENLADVARQAPPPPAGGQVVGQFTVRLVGATGATEHAVFEEPVLVEFSLPLSELSPGADIDSLVLVYWNGSGWVEVPATVARHDGERVTLTARLLHFTLFSVLEGSESWGTFSRTAAGSRVTTAVWRGGDYERLRDALGDDTLWVLSAGRWFSYRPQAPSFTNALFLQTFPDGLPSTSPAILVR